MKKSFTIILVLVGFQLFTIRLSSQNIGIGTTMPLAPLDVNGKTRTTDFQMTNGGGAGNILQSDASGNASWAQRSSVMANEWHIGGNAGTVDGTSFIGTTDNVPFTIRVNNQKAGRIENTLANTFFGYQSGNANTTGSDNTAVGKNALLSNTAAGENTAIGSGALYSLSWSPGYSWITDNTAIGYHALYSNQPSTIDNAKNNTAVGSYALKSNINGYDNTGIGSNALFSNIYGSRNIAIGKSALYSNIAGSGNIAIGSNALAEQSFDPGSGSYTYNIAVGVEALRYNQPSSEYNGRYNTAIGTIAMRNNETGYQNTASGYEALTYNSDGNNNTASGYEALWGNSHGSFNTATGALSLNNNNTGQYNTANGYDCLSGNFGGTYNTASGYHALSSNTTGSHNTAFGVSSILTNVSGDYNTALGRNAYYLNSTLDNTTCLGYNSGGVVNASNRIEIGNTSVTWIGGQVGWMTYSDARIKDNVKEDVPGLVFISKLHPVTYNLNIHKQNAIVYKGTNKDSADWDTKYDIEKIKMTGFLAQDVERAAQESGYDFSGLQKPGSPDELYSLRYSDFVMPLVKSVQELNAEVVKLKSENAALTERIGKIEALLAGNQQH